LASFDPNYFDPRQVGPDLQGGELTDITIPEFRWPPELQGWYGSGGGGGDNGPGQWIVVGLVVGGIYISFCYGDTTPNRAQYELALALALGPFLLWVLYALIARFIRGSAHRQARRDYKHQFDEAVKVLKVRIRAQTKLQRGQQKLAMKQIKVNARKVKKDREPTLRGPDDGDIEVAKSILQFALSQQTEPYLFNREGHSKGPGGQGRGFDCSLLVEWACRDARVALVPVDGSLTSGLYSDFTAEDLWKKFSNVYTVTGQSPQHPDFGKLRLGDLLFFRMDGEDKPVDHVGVFNGVWTDPLINVTGPSMVSALNHVATPNKSELKAAGSTQAQEKLTAAMAARGGVRIGLIDSPYWITRFEGAIRPSRHPQTAAIPEDNR
jgi:cell wall-associated NlpC family hydrolase